ncbi:(d)CMP kinase [Algoriphagus sediminis]|uniref:Cytidylate kinase n=1 Tax=Algoriphagus sediminis TaxID=3057113 RepID=A0ABT7YF48_9BACT|nr:(d)CMP kinase [Algoriphagus sediminis]MDN3205123.1 (d)CMP kinase [Algoriphagus sediminis]
MGKIVIAIDGQSGCGKSSTAKAVAKSLGYTYLDSGAMYRAVTYYYLQNPFDLGDAESVSRALENVDIEFRLNPEDGSQLTFLNGENVEAQIRQMEVSKSVSKVAAVKLIREAMVAQQRKLGAAKGVVMDGRDIGSVVFPDAALKVYMTADLETRAKRRLRELSADGGVYSLKEIQKNLAERDKLDSSREESPLVKMEDAVELDTSELKFEDQVNFVIDLARERIEKEETYASKN